MKIKEIAKLAKRSGILILFDQEEGCQWVSVGAAIYPLHGIPKLDTRTLPRVLDLSDKEMEKITVSQAPLPKDYDFSSYASDENPADDPIISLGTGDKIYYPVESEDGILFYDPIYLKPIRDEENEIYIRHNAEGIAYFAVQHGTFLQAVILQLLPDIEDLHNRLSIVETSVLKRLEAEKHPGSVNLRLDPETGEILEG